MGRQADRQAEPQASSRPLVLRLRIVVLRQRAQGLQRLHDGGMLAAIEPSTPTAMPLALEKRPADPFVWLGPENPSNSSVGWGGSAASSSARFGKRARPGEHELVAMVPPSVTTPPARSCGAPRPAAPAPCDRAGLVQADVVAGSQPQQDDVVVVVDQPRHHCAALEVDHFGTALPRGPGRRPRRIPVVDQHRVTTRSWRSIVWILPLMRRIACLPSQSRSSRAAAGVAAMSPPARIAAATSALADCHRHGRSMDFSYRGTAGPDRAEDELGEVRGRGCTRCEPANGGGRPRSARPDRLTTTRTPLIGASPLCRRAPVDLLLSLLAWWITERLPNRRGLPLVFLV